MSGTPPRAPTTAVNLNLGGQPRGSSCSDTSTRGRSAWPRPKCSGTPRRDLASAHHPSGSETVRQDARGSATTPDASRPSRPGPQGHHAQPTLYGDIPVRSAMPLATITPAGTKVFLIPLRPARHFTLPKGTSFAGPIARTLRQRSRSPDLSGRGWRWPEHTRTDQGRRSLGHFRASPKPSDHPRP
jgi:hypothetical protein